MATYNKRGYKPKAKKEKTTEEDEIFDEDESTTAEVFGTLDETANSTEKWLEKNQNIIFGAVIVIALGVFGYWAYTHYVASPQQDAARGEMAQASSFYEQAVNASGTEKDSLYMLALEGGEGKYGLLKIIENYGGTDAANLAHYQAGMAYLNLGGDKYQKAIDHLTEFDGGESVLAVIAKAGIGDALVQVNQLDDAIKYYIEAAETRPNEFTTPKYLLKAAQISLKNDDAAQAEELLNRIVDEYPEVEEVSTAKVLLGRAQAQSA